jgi:hypothetical protein
MYPKIEKIAAGCIPSILSPKATTSWSLTSRCSELGGSRRRAAHWRCRASSKKRLTAWCKQRRPTEGLAVAWSKTVAAHRSTDGWRKINGYQFLDLYPADREKQHHDLNLHSIYKISRLGDALSVVPLDYEWLKVQWSRDKLAIPAWEGDNSLVLTMDTRALQQFVADHAADDEAFNPGKRIVFHRRLEWPTW